MDRHSFEELLQQLQEAELEISRTKGKEYALGEDVLQNFKAAASFLTVASPQQICLVYMSALINASGDTAPLGVSESLRSRVTDLRLYAGYF